MRGQARGTVTRHTYIALLRGVNVGRSQRIAMADLRALVEGLGYGHVRTLLNSGNVLFTGRRLTTTRVAGQLEATLAKRLGLSVRVVVLTAEELAAAAAANTLTVVASDPSRLVFAITPSPEPLHRLEPLLAQDWGPEALAAGPRAAYFWCPGGFARSPVAEAVRRALGESATMRNWATIGKLVELSAGTRR